MKICLCSASDAHTLATCDTETFMEYKKEIIKYFDHIEGMLKHNFTDQDEAIFKRDQAEREREKKRAKTKRNDNDEYAEMEDIDLPEEIEELGKESLTPRSKKAVESMKCSFSFDNASIITRFAEPVDI